MDNLKQQLQTLTDAEIADLEGLIDAEKAARIKDRNDKLAEFPTLSPVGQPDHKIQVTKARAEELLATGQYIVVSD